MKYIYCDLQALLGLAQQLSQSKPKGLSKSEIDLLPLFYYDTDAKRSERNQTRCVICMSDFETRQRIRVLVCNHEFHSKCIDKWLKVSEIRLGIPSPVQGICFTSNDSQT